MDFSCATLGDSNDSPHHTKSIQSLFGWFIVYQIYPNLNTNINLHHRITESISYLSYAWYASCFIFIMNHESFLTHPSPTFLKSLWRCKTSRPKAPSDVQQEIGRLWSIQLAKMGDFRQPPWRSVGYMEENMAPYPSSPGVFSLQDEPFKSKTHRHSMLSSLAFFGYEQYMAYF